MRVAIQAFLEMTRRSLAREKQLPAIAGSLSVIFVNFALIVFAVLLMLAGCGRREEQPAAANSSSNKPPASASHVTNKPQIVVDPSTIDPKVVGTWIWGGEITNGLVRGGSLTFAPDGTYVSRSTNATGTTNVTIFEGNWGVKEGVLVFRYTRSSAPRSVPRSGMNRFKVVRLDEKELALADIALTETNVMQRRK
jgi:hypothetical protein